jgi:signal transduction histidine kinase
VTIAVADTGVGIPAEHVPRIFERFYRVDPARTRASGGTGLGLALVRNAVERSGGTVEISSAVGHGTKLTIRLPRAL